MGVENLNTNIYRSFDACVVGAQKNRLFEMAVLSLGMEILCAISYLFFETCIVGALGNRLIETAVLSTFNHCLGVEI